MPVKGQNGSLSYQGINVDLAQYLAANLKIT